MSLFLCFFFSSLGYRTLLWVFGHVPGSLIEAAKRVRGRERERGGKGTDNCCCCCPKPDWARRTHTNTHTVVYFIMMDGYDCTQCACVCVYTSFSRSLVALHLLAFSWPGKLPPCWASFIDSFVHSHLNFRMRKLVQQHVAANYGSQLASRTLATLHFDPLGDLCSRCCCCWNRPSWLASASVFAVILRRKSLRREGSRERGIERGGGGSRVQGKGLPHRVCSGFFSSRCCCFCATNVS